MWGGHVYGGWWGLALLSCEPQRWNSGSQAWQQVPLPCAHHRHLPLATCFDNSLQHFTTNKYPLSYSACTSPELPKHHLLSLVTLCKAVSEINLITVCYSLLAPHVRGQTSTDWPGSSETLLINHWGATPYPALTQQYYMPFTLWWDEPDPVSKWPMFPKPGKQSASETAPVTWWCLDKKDTFWNQCNSEVAAQ